MSQMGTTGAIPGGAWRKKTKRVLYWCLPVLLTALVIDGFYIAQLWPDWQALRSGAVPKSRFIRDYEDRRQGNTDLPRLLWRPVPLRSIPEFVRRAMIVAEDSRFYQHSGFDFQAVRSAAKANFKRGRLAFGASTISQQTAKNLFLSRERSWLRKWHETILTIGLETQLSKQRILEIYLNSVELGGGIFGVAAAARYYWGRSLGDLSLRQAAELAASLPAPTSANPVRRSDYFRKHAAKIHRRLEYVLRIDGVSGN